MTPADAKRLAEEWMTWSEWAGAHPPEHFRTAPEPPTPLTGGDSVVVADHLARAALSLSAQLERQAKVVEAAREWVSTVDFAASRVPGEVFTVEQKLADAIAALDAARKGAET